MASESAGNGPPGSPLRGDESDLNTTNDGGPVNVSNAVLSTISMWVDRLPAREVEALAMKFFPYEKLEDAVHELKPFIKCTLPHRNQTDVLARNLVGAVIKLGQADEPIVEFLVKSKDLFSIPGVESSLMPLDVSSVGARLLGMEASIETLSTSMQQMGNVAKAVDTLASVVTRLQEQQRQVVLPPVPVSARSGNGTAGQGPLKPLYSEAAAKSSQEKRKRGDSSPNSPRQETPHRPQPATPPSALFQEALAQNGVSQMLKQQRELAEGRTDELDQDGFQQVLGKHKKLLRKKKLLQGSSEVKAGGGHPVPFSVFIRNTDPSYSEGDVKRYLEECADSLPPEEKLSEKLDILQVCNIPIKKTDGGALRSKCWKVTVASQFKEHMLSPKAYPSSWFARQWFRNGNQLPGNAASLQQGSYSAANVQQSEHSLLHSSTGAELLQIGNMGNGQSSIDEGA